MIRLDASWRLHLGGILRRDQEVPKSKYIDIETSMIFGELGMIFGELAVCSRTMFSAWSHNRTEGNDRVSNHVDGK